MTRLIAHFANDAGQSIVGFEADPSPTTVAGKRYLTIKGARAYLIGNTACGTCEFLFEKLWGATRTFEEEAGAVSAMLRDLRELPPEEALTLLGRLLPPGDYAVALLSARPHLAMPANEFDYFTHECVDLFGIDPYFGVPHSPKTPYYRLCTLPAPPGGLVIELGIPLHPPGRLERDRVEDYKIELQQGRSPAAFAIGVLDIRQPADWEGEPEITKHFVLAQYLLDGHDKMQAAAELESEVQVLSFVSRDASIYGYGDPGDLDRVLNMLLEGSC